MSEFILSPKMPLSFEKPAGSWPVVAGFLLLILVIALGLVLAKNLQTPDPEKP